MRLEDLIAQITDAAYKRIMENRTVSEDEAKDTARLVGIAALKYGDLSNQATKDYVFRYRPLYVLRGKYGAVYSLYDRQDHSILKKYEELSGTKGRAARSRRPRRSRKRH